MADLGDVVGALTAMNRAGGAIDAANLAASNDPQVQDAPGAPVGSGLANYYFQNNGGALPAGIQNIVATKQATALQKVGNDYINQTPYLNGMEAPKDANGNYDPNAKPLGYAEALMKMGQIKGEDPTATIGMIGQMQMTGLMPTNQPQQRPTASAIPPSGITSQPNQMTQQAPALASMAPMGGDVQSAPVAPMDNPNAPANGGGSTLSQGFAPSRSYPALVASNGLMASVPQAAPAQRTAAFMPPAGAAPPQTPSMAPNQSVVPVPSAQTGQTTPGSMVDGMTPQEKGIMFSAIQQGKGVAGGLADVQALRKSQADTGKAQADTAETKAKTIVAPSGGPISDAQKDEDKQFGPAWGTFKNQGGSDQVRLANDAIDDALNKLRTGKVTTGGPIDRFSTDAEGHPGYIGSAFNGPLIATKTEVDSAISPLLKPLFGARVTNFEASNLQKSLGIDPYADTNLNIQKLIRLKDKINSGALDLKASGQYFDTHGGTLAEYPGNTSITQPNQSAAPQQVQPHMIYGTPERAAAIKYNIEKLKAAQGGR